MSDALEVDSGPLPPGEKSGDANSGGPTPSAYPRDPLHGVKLETIINALVEQHGWAAMGQRIPIRCFQINPSVKSALTFLRKTPWARQRVEGWYLNDLSNQSRG